MNSSTVAYIYDEDIRTQCDKLPKMRFRATIVQELINSYGLLQNPRVKITKPIRATDSELQHFHSSSYIEFIKHISDKHEVNEDEEKDLEQFGLTYDCPFLENLYDFISIIAGGSLTAAKELVDTECKVAINWFGGWHHAQRDEAEGFCYVNDIVIAIHKLLEKFERILYIDLDVHHGNGVQNAFEFSKKVLTLSLHQVSPGFYPGTGFIHEIGSGRGKYFSLNVPFMEGIADATYKSIFTPIFKRVCDSFKPTALVVQCGADILSNDPIGQCNVTTHGMGDCIKTVLNYDVPTLFLGGGGYNFGNTSRYWTYLTSIILNQNISEDIPDSSLFFTEYLPTYELHVCPGNMKDNNRKEDVSRLIKTISSYCDNITTA